jgi:tRNA (guanine37-N1)-methyltransferase
MQFDLITLMPDMFHALDYGVVGQAIDKGLLSYQCHNPRDFTTAKHGQVDDRPYGGGPGMVLQYQPLRDCLNSIAHKPSSKVVYLGPEGRTFDHQLSLEASELEQIIFVCGRYEGIDQRFIDHHVDEIWSIGDFILSGGETAALCMIDSVARHIPAVLGHEQSAIQDSFYNGLLDHPHYTRPEAIDEYCVPNVLLSGNHQAIESWRMQQALGKTWQMRPDLVKRHTLNEKQQKLLNEFINSAKKEQ